MKVLARWANSLPWGSPISVTPPGMLKNAAFCTVGDSRFSVFMVIWCVPGDAQHDHDEPQSADGCGDRAVGALRLLARFWQ